MWAVMTTGGSVLGFLLMVAAISAVAAYRASSTVQATAAEILSIVTLVGAKAILLFDVGPRLEQLYIGFGVELPQVTVWAIRALRSGLVPNALFLVNLAGLGIVGGLQFYYFHRQESTRRHAQRWSLIATVAVTTFIILLTAAMLLPLPRLLNDLA